MEFITSCIAIEASGLLSAKQAKASIIYKLPAYPINKKNSKHLLHFIVSTGMVMDIWAVISTMRDAYINFQECVYMQQPTFIWSLTGSFIEQAGPFLYALFPGYIDVSSDQAATGPWLKVYKSHDRRRSEKQMKWQL